MNTPYPLRPVENTSRNFGLVTVYAFGVIAFTLAVVARYGGAFPSPIPAIGCVAAAVAVGLLWFKVLLARRSSPPDTTRAAYFGLHIGTTLVLILALILAAIGRALTAAHVSL